MDPPKFEIVDFTNNISVNVKFQLDSPRIPSEELQFYLAFIEEHAGNSVKRVSGQNSSDLAMNTLLKETPVMIWTIKTEGSGLHCCLTSRKTSPGFSINGSREML